MIGNRIEVLQKKSKYIRGFPKFYLVKQKLSTSPIYNIEEYFTSLLDKSGLHKYIAKDGMIGIAVGSRGINGLKEIIHLLVGYIKDHDGIPVIIPAMGSHGGACAKGQREVLESLGVTGGITRAKTLCNMDIVDIGPTEDGKKVFFSTMAMTCDTVIVVNRIKEHTDFYGETESGILKMLAVGLGKDTGASYIHSLGAVGLSRDIPAIAAKIIEMKKIVGIGIMEDGGGKTAKIDILFGKEILEKEKDLLNYAKSLKPKIPYQKLNYLIIEEIGKNISGSGVDTKVIGRIRYPGIDEPKSPSPDIIAGLRLTAESHGNAAGIGLLDIISQKLYRQIDFKATFENGKSSKSPERYKIPMFMEDAHETVKTGLEFAKVFNTYENKVMLIKNTSMLEYFFVSEELLDESETIENLEIIQKKPFTVCFNMDNEYESIFARHGIN